MYKIYIILNYILRGKNYWKERQKWVKKNTYYKKQEDIEIREP